MQKKYFNSSIVILLLTGYFVFAIPDNKTDNIALSGKDLFRLNCSGCHGLNMQGNLPTYPSLVNINQKLSRTDVTNQIKNGKNLMPPLDHLSQPQIRLWLLDQQKRS